MCDASYSIQGYGIVFFTGPHYSGMVEKITFPQLEGEIFYIW